MRIGSLVYATCQGLGYLAKSFYDNGIVTDPVVVEHTTHPNQDWFPDALRVPIRGLCRDPHHTEIREMLARCDAVVFFETPFDWTLIDFLRGRKIPTALVTMHECTPAQIPHPPDQFWCPSLLDYWEFAGWKGIHVPPLPFRCLVENPNVVFAPVPVSVPWRQRTRVETFVHNAGHGSFRDRNGTAALLAALPHVTKPCRLILRSQRDLESWKQHKRVGVVDVEYLHGTFDYDTLWAEGDAFVFPERFNGISLPLQEARAAGMLVIAMDRFPVNTWLPREGLVPAAGYVKARIGGAYREYDEAVVEPRAVATKIDEWVGRDVTAYSLSGAAWAQIMSWPALGPCYRRLLEDLCNAR